MPKTPEYPREVIVPAGTEINRGQHEDGDSFFTNGPTKIVKLGSKEHGAFPVRLSENGEEIPGPFFYHQPEPKSKV